MASNASTSSWRMRRLSRLGISVMTGPILSSLDRASSAELLHLGCERYLGPRRAVRRLKTLRIQVVDERGQFPDAGGERRLERVGQAVLVIGRLGGAGLDRVQVKLAFRHWSPVQPRPACLASRCFCHSALR